MNLNELNNNCELHGDRNQLLERLLHIYPKMK